MEDNELLKEILEELKIANTHLSKITNNHATDLQDLEMAMDGIQSTLDTVSLKLDK